MIPFTDRLKVDVNARLIVPHRAQAIGKARWGAYQKCSPPSARPRRQPNFAKS